MPLSRLRHRALAAQGLVEAQPYGLALAGTQQALEHLAYVQLDSIAVIERAHHHVLYNRVPDFQPEWLHQLLRSGGIFEYWAHAAAFLPMTDFRFSLPYKHALRNGQVHWYKNPDRQRMAEVLARIRAEGPLRARDLETEAKTAPSSGWWDWKPNKQALEQLYMEGELMVCERSAGFQKTYDLTERVLPPEVDTRLPSLTEWAAHLLEQRLRCDGSTTLSSVLYQRRHPALRSALQALIKARLAEQRLEQVELSNGEVYLIEPGALDGTEPASTERLSILSPFDNSVIQRARLKSLFNFDFQLECYLPATQRRYGYFCLPLLYRDRFIGRMDSKAHRSKRHLDIKALHWEDHAFQEDAVLAAFAEAITAFKRFQHCDTVSVSAVYPSRGTEAVRRVLREWNHF